MGWYFKDSRNVAEHKRKSASAYYIDSQGVIFNIPPPAPLGFSSLFRSHIAREMLTYCHAPAHSCSRLIPCEDRALTIRGFPRPAPGTQRCKVFS